MAKKVVITNPIHIAANHLEELINARLLAFKKLAEQVDLVTFEFENVPSETVASLEHLCPACPNANALRVARDRFFEKSLFQQLGIETPPFANVNSQAELDFAVNEIDFDPWKFLDKHYKHNNNDGQFWIKMF